MQTFMKIKLNLSPLNFVISLLVITMVIACTYTVSKMIWPTLYDYPFGVNLESLTADGKTVTTSFAGVALCTGDEAVVSTMNNIGDTIRESARYNTLKNLLVPSGPMEKAVINAITNSECEVMLFSGIGVYQPSGDAI